MKVGRDNTESKWGACTVAGTELPTPSLFSGNSSVEALLLRYCGRPPPNPGKNSARHSGGTVGWKKKRGANWCEVVGNGLKWLERSSFGLRAGWPLRGVYTPRVQFTR
jgi:hypothetical protein